MIKNSLKILNNDQINLILEEMKHKLDIDILTLSTRHKKKIMTSIKYLAHKICFH